MLQVLFLIWSPFPLIKVRKKVQESNHDLWGRGLSRVFPTFMLPGRSQSMYIVYPHTSLPTAELSGNSNSYFQGLKSADCRIPPTKKNNNRSVPLPVSLILVPHDSIITMSYFRRVRQEILLASDKYADVCQRPRSIEVFTRIPPSGGIRGINLPLRERQNN